MPIFLILVVMIGTAFSMLAISPSVLGAAESSKALWSDATQHGFNTLNHAYRGYKLAHQNDIIDPEAVDTHIPVAYRDVVPLYGYSPRAPVGTYWNYERNEGGNPFLCLAGTVDDQRKFDGIREGALKAGAVFSTNPVCGGQVTFIAPTVFPTDLSVTFYLD